MLAKAPTLPADEVFVDLEDAVAPELKNDDDAARRRRARSAAEWLAPTRAVRVNAVGTPWCLDDLLAVVGEAGDVLDCVIVPKVESAAQVHRRRVSRDLDAAGPRAARSGSRCRSSRRAASSRSSGSRSPRRASRR